MDTLGGKQELTIINESGLYALILRSRKPEAKKFRKWITSEVLPAIRKKGIYANQKPEDIIKNIIGCKRFLFYIDHHNQMHAKIIEPDIWMGTEQDFIDSINTYDNLVSNETVINLAKACINRLTHKVTNYQMQLLSAM